MTAANSPASNLLISRVLLLGGIGAIVSAVGALADRAQFYRSYLLAYLFVAGIGLGCLVLLMLQYATGGAWGLLLRRTLEAATRTLPLLVLLFVPLAFAVLDPEHTPYTWARPNEVASDPLLQHKSLYLNPQFFLVRTAVYFAVWLLWMLLLNRWSHAHDASGDPADAQRLRTLSGPGMGLYGLTITFAAIDWAMSLEPHWSSTMYPLLFAAGQVLSGFVFVVGIVLLLADQPPLDHVLNRSLRGDLGKLLLALVMFWSYLAFSQFLLIWSGNLPENIPWYQRRLDGQWEKVALLVLLFHFFLPFLLLLSPNVKRGRQWLWSIAGIVLVMRLADTYWQIKPAFHEGDERYQELHWLDAATLVGVGGLWLALFLWELRRYPLIPARATGFPPEEHHG